MRTKDLLQNSFYGILERFIFSLTSVMNYATAQSLRARQFKRRFGVNKKTFEHVNRRLKIFKIISERYRNRRRRYGLRCNLIAAI